MQIHGSGGRHQKPSNRAALAMSPAKSSIKSKAEPSNGAKSWRHTGIDIAVESNMYDRRLTGRRRWRHLTTGEGRLGEALNSLYAGVARRPQNRISASGHRSATEAAGGVTKAHGR